MDSRGGYPFMSYEIIPCPYCKGEGPWCPTCGGDGKIRIFHEEPKLSPWWLWALGIGCAITLACLILWGKP